MALTLKQNSWVIELPLQPNNLRLGLIRKSQWLTSVNPLRFMLMPGEVHSSVTYVLYLMYSTYAVANVAGSVRNKPHRIDVAVTHHAPAYLGEEFPVTVDVTNVDDRDFDVVVDVLLHPLEVEHASAYIVSP